MAAGAVVALALALPAPAGAQGIDPGVNYDPGGPAGKQYAIPIVLGRAEGSGTEDQRAAANTPFGVGIEPPAGGSGRGAAGRGEPAPRRRGAGSDDPATIAPGASPERRAEIISAGEPGGTALWSLGIALAVLLPAALLAAGLSSRRTHAT